MSTIEEKLIKLGFKKSIWEGTYGDEPFVYFTVGNNVLYFYLTNEIWSFKTSLTESKIYSYDRNSAGFSDNGWVEIDAGMDLNIESLILLYGGV